jgi:5,10-methenyltetrahydrofolate synthetase
MTKPDEIAKQKADLRWAMIDKRDALAENARLQWSHIITQKLLAAGEYKNANTILAYKNIGSEFDTSEFIRELLASGKILVLPKVNKAKKTLDIFRVANPDTDLQKGVWGIAEPDPEKCKRISISEVDFVLVPGLAFDARGQRVGYGGGYYDKLLAERNSKTHLIAAAYAMQVVCEVPALSHDTMVEKVITENSI